MGDVLFVGVELVKDEVGVRLVRRSEYDDFIQLAKFPEKPQTQGSNFIHPSRLVEMDKSFI